MVAVKADRRSALDQWLEETSATVEDSLAKIKDVALAESRWVKERIAKRGVDKPDKT